MENFRKTTDTEKEIMQFLNNLRETGVTNMFGAGPYIHEEFPEVSKAEATRILSLWMQNFNEESNYGQVKI